MARDLPLILAVSTSLFHLCWAHPTWSPQLSGICSLAHTHTTTTTTAAAAP